MFEGFAGNRMRGQRVEREELGQGLLYIIYIFTKQ
jgi:hypothetical protein